MTLLLVSGIVVSLVDVQRTCAQATGENSTQRDVADVTEGNSATHNALSQEEIDEGWMLLFDGQSLYGWRAEGDANFRVQEGCITVTEGDVCLLRSTTQFGDYQLRVDFKAGTQTNSGIFLRTPPEPRDPASDCYELNIAPADNPFPTGSFVKRQQVVDAMGTDDQWHTYEVTAVGGNFVVKLDGKTILQYDDSNWLGRGFIGLQHNSGPVAFRNVKLRPLGLDYLFNGQDLTGWKTYPDMDSQFSVTDQGYLHVEGGRGQLETEQAYGDFVLQLECQTHAENLNSGIFFRCIPGEEMMGYESQIHHGMVDGDPTKPMDCGTGGIFRRTTARRIVADDNQWFRKTVIAEGPHIAVWVNGYQVTDWTDTRPPHENPRKGRRTKPGTIMIQGHDPTTDISFRDLRIGNMARRWPDERQD